MLGAAAVPTTASATVLVEASRNVSCGNPIRTGVWDRPDGRTQSRTVKIRIRSARGFVLWSRTVRAASSWRYFRYRPTCGRSYRVTYENPQFGTESFRVKARD